MSCQSEATRNCLIFCFETAKGHEHAKTNNPQCSWTRTFHGNLHFARQFSCFTRFKAFSGSNNRLKFKLPRVKQRNCRVKCELPCKQPGSTVMQTNYQSIIQSDAVITLASSFPDTLNSTKHTKIDSC